MLWSKSKQMKVPATLRRRGFPTPRSSTASGVVRSTIDDASELLTAAAVRDRCGIVFAAAERGESRHFRLVTSRLGEAGRRVVEITRRSYPDLDVPYHSRWRHFSVGGVDRAAQVAPGADPDEVARARIDLSVASVLLDA